MRFPHGWRCLFYNQREGKGMTNGIRVTLKNKPLWEYEQKEHFNTKDIRVEFYSVKEVQ